MMVRTRHLISFVFYVSCFYSNNESFIECLGACRLVNEMTVLNNFTVSGCPNIDNRLLKTALTTGRWIDIYCMGTSVNLEEFILENTDTVKQECSSSPWPCSKIGCRYDCKDLAFWC